VIEQRPSRPPGCGSSSVIVRPPAVTLRWQRIKCPRQPQLRPVVLCVEDRCLPLARQVLEVIGVDQRLLEFSTLAVAHLGQRRVADDFPDAVAQRDARHRQSLDRTGYWAGDVAGAIGLVRRKPGQLFSPPLSRPPTHVESR
jgi:hypothetical protein